LRTADEHFTDLPEFPYAARYCDDFNQATAGQRIIPRQPG
jgi:hypothetical protein